MAATAITIGATVAGALPILLPLAQNAVVWVEHIFGAGSGTQTKLPVATSIVQQVADKLSAAGTIQGILDPTAIGSIVQTAVGILQAEGVLNPTAASAIVSASSALLKPAPAASPVPAALAGTAIKLTGTFTIG